MDSLCSNSSMTLPEEGNLRVLHRDLCLDCQEATIFHDPQKDVFPYKRIFSAAYGSQGRGIEVLLYPRSEGSRLEKLAMCNPLIYQAASMTTEDHRRHC